MDKLINIQKKIRFKNQKKLFQLISQEINKQNIDYNKFKTINGNTQNSERISINIVKQCLDNLNYSYTEAHSQGSKDFRNICNIGLNIEVKKTDKYKIMFNDTLPSPNIYYIIMFTGKNFKHKRNKNIKPQIIFINGFDLIKDDYILLNEYKNEIEEMRNKWSRKNKCKNANNFKYASVCPRPSYTTDIRHLLNYE